MTIRFHNSILCFLGILAGSGSAAAQGNEIESLRAALDALRADYEVRIAAIEKRLALAEQGAGATGYPAPPRPAAATAVAATRSSGSGNAFNPAIGVIFQGQAWNYQHQPDGYAIQGFPLGGEAGPFDEGLAIGEAEINISASVDDKFTAWLTAPLVVEGGESGIEIEEAWLEATALPAGLSARFGRFFSGIGYLNNKHAHAWDFADQPLAYQAFLGGQYLDDGIQLRWVPPTGLYMEAGAEVFRGSRYPAAGSGRSGYGSRSLYLNIGGDIGTDNSWLAGISGLTARGIDRESGDEDNPLVFNGDADTVGAHFVWKWAPDGNWKQRNLAIQTEWLWRSENGSYTLPGGPPLPYDVDQHGGYLQAVYQPFPRWRFGARIDSLSSATVPSLFAGSPLEAPVADPLRYGVMADWSNSEFSRLRLQYMRDEAAVTGNDNQWGLQYLLSIGAHGGHSF